MTGADHARLGNSGTLAPRLDGDDLWVEVLKLARFDSAVVHEGIDLVLFETDHPPEPVRRQLSLIDQTVEGSWRQPERCSRFLCREPIAICLSHVTDISSISSLLGLPENLPNGALR